MAFRRILSGAVAGGVLAVAAVGASRRLPPPADAGAAADDEYRLDAARRYIEALHSHDPSGVPFHPRITRTERGVTTGFSGAHLRLDLRYGPQFRLIRGIEEVTLAARDGQVVADFVVDTAFAGRDLTRARVHETFTFDRAHPRLIRRIVADIDLESPRGR